MWDTYIQSEWSMVILSISEWNKCISALPIRDKVNWIWSNSLLLFPRNAIRMRFNFNYQQSELHFFRGLEQFQLPTYLILAEILIVGASDFFFRKLVNQLQPSQLVPFTFGEFFSGISNCFSFQIFVGNELVSIMILYDRNITETSLLLFSVCAHPSLKV